MFNSQTVLFFSKLKKQIWVILIIWAAAVSISLGWNLSKLHNSINELALFTARTASEKDVLYRQWAALHGGVYVPVTEETQPNPYLEFVEERDIFLENKTLTLINPAYMTRQVFQLQSSENLIFSHITSLNPLNPDNSPYSYEFDALQSFEDGQKEFFQEIKIDGKNYFFYMQALFVDESCLSCHQSQGYEVGQVRGGISQVVSYQSFTEIMNSQRVRIIWLHILFYVIGVIVFGTFYYFLRSDMKYQLDHERKLMRLGYFDSLTGLYSRSFYVDILKKNTYYELQPLTVVYFDVDNLKLVNDQEGHAAGDKLLQRFTQVLHKVFREGDIKMRLGGDEFVVIMPKIKLEEDELASRIEQEVIANNLQNPNLPQLSISFGITSVTGYQNLEEGLQNADQEMYKQKQNKKNTSQ